MTKVVLRARFIVFAFFFDLLFFLQKALYDFDAVRRIAEQTNINGDFQKYIYIYNMRIKEATPEHMDYTIIYKT